MTHSEVRHTCCLHFLCHDSFISTTCVTGWRRLIGSPKLQIIFHKRATQYKSLLRKMTYKDKGSYESSPPCIPVWWDAWEWLLLYLSEVWHDSFHTYVGHASFVGGTWLIHTWHMAHSHAGHDSFTFVTWLIDIRVQPNICSIWVAVAPRMLCIRMWDMTHAYVGHDSSIVGHDSCICGTWPMHMISDCDTNIVLPKRLLRLECCGFVHVSHLYVRHNSFICGTWLIRMWDMTHSYGIRLRRNGCSTWAVVAPRMLRIRTYIQFVRWTWLIRIWDMAYSYDIRLRPNICSTWAVVAPRMLSF